MKRQLMLAACLSFLVLTLGVQVVKADTIYSNLSPGSTYYTSAGVCVCGSGYAGVSLLFADAFTVPAGPGYNLTGLDVGVTNYFGTNSAIIELLTNSGGSPGSTVLGSWTLTGLPHFPYASSIHPSQTISGISAIVLSGGTQYWLAVFPGASDTADVWAFNSTGATATYEVSIDGGTTWELGGDILQAFDVLGTPVSAVPEPSTALLLVTGLVGLLALARKSI